MPVPDMPPLETARADSGAGRRLLWGYFSGYAHPEEGIFTLTPLRAAGTHINLVSTLNNTAGVTAEVIWKESYPEFGILSVSVTLVHPYPGNPIYAGFDVRGILITGASQPIGAGLWTAGHTEPLLINPDGYTRWWNPVEFLTPGLFGYTDGVLGAPNLGGFDAKLNAYKIFADAFPSETEDDLTCLNLPQLDDDDGRAVFSGGANSRRYEIRFPAGASYFNYAVDASWAFPKVSPPEIPDDFPPGANCPEAWWIKCTEVENTLIYYPDSGTHEGNLSISVIAYDWQGRMNGLTAPEISAVNIFSDELLGAAVGQATLLHDQGVSAIYQADLSSLCKPTKSGLHWLGIEVVSSKGAYKQSWQSAPSGPIAAYYLMAIRVREGVPNPELMKRFGIHAYVLRKSDGSAPAIYNWQINEDIEWANEFWRRYGFEFVLSQHTYIDSSEYYKCIWYECKDVYDAHHDESGMINLYYFKDIIGFSCAFATVHCHAEDHTAPENYIMFDATDAAEWGNVLAHELGHCIGMLHDEYILDEFNSCEAIQYYYCGTPTSDLYCDEDDEVWGNLMWYGIPGPANGPYDYFLSNDDLGMTTPEVNSQAEHVAHFHTHYPDNFKGM